MKRKPWMVSLKLDGISKKSFLEKEFDDPEFEFELSVVRKGEHGVTSWGWADENKIIISDDLGTAALSTRKQVWKIANLLCETLNQEGV